MFVFLFLLFGTCALAKNSLKIPTALLPIFVFPSISLVLYAGALCNQLALAANVLIAAGVVGFIYQVYLSFFSKKNREFDSTALALIIVIFIFGLLTKPLLYFASNSFGFWGIVTKILFYTHTLPTTRSPGINVSFLNYPPGSNLFEYFALKINGAFSESLSIFCVALLCIAPLLSIFMLAHEFLGNRRNHSC